MVIGFLSFEIYLPYSHSLKEKRKHLSGLKDRLKKKFNIAFAELDFQDKWQRAKIGIVTLNNQRALVEQFFQTIISDVERILDGEILNVKKEFF